MAFQDVIRKYYKKLKKNCRKYPMAAMLGMAISIYYGKLILKNRNEVKLSYFLAAVTKNLISEVIVSSSQMIKFRGVDSDIWYQTNAEMLSKDKLFHILHDKESITYHCESPQKNNDALLASIFGLAISWALLKQQFSKEYSPKSADDFHQNLRFEDIAGLQDAKIKLGEIINFLNEPEKYRRVGARLRKGVLLYGPPGTGKTMLAKATAGESKSHFLYTTASEFVEMYVGVGAKRIRELFKKARQQSPCIIFIDEIDGLGSKRSSQFQEQQGSDQERATTLNQLLTEMDGFSENCNIVVIAATNREQLLDKALIRSGRFDTKIKVGLPDEKDRLGVLDIHMKHKQHDVKEECLSQIAKKSQGMSGADLESVVNESAYLCIKNNRQVITEQDVEASFNKFRNEKYNFDKNQ